MKTVKQIADELGVTKQAVMYRIQQLEATKENGILATKENGILVVSLSAEKLIKSAFYEKDRQKNHQAFGDKEPTKETTSFDGEMVKLFQETISTLQQQLAEKDRQLAEAHRLLDQQQQLQLQSQTLFSAKPNIFKRLFPGKNKE